MIRFIATTLLAIAAAAAIIGLLDGWPRLFAMAGLWLAYGTVIGCGVAFIWMQFFLPAVCRGATGRMRVALTFDDGPDPAATPALLDLLHREGIEAAFFCIGKNVAAHPALAARITAEGHLLGNHTYRHSWGSAFLFRRGWAREMALTCQAIEHATGVTPLYMRPPMGLTNPHLAWALEKSRLTLVGWDIRSLDTAAGPARKVIERIVRRARDGSIILLHDGGASPGRLVEIVAMVAAELRAKGLEFDRLDRLINPSPAIPDRKS